MAEIANEDIEFSVTQQGAAIPGLASGGLSDTDSNTSAGKAKANSKAILITSIGQSTPHTAWGCKSPLQDSGATKAVITQGFTMTATIQKVKCDNAAPLQKGDFTLCACTGTDTVSGSPPVVTPFVGSCRIENTNAGQDKVTGV